jgi:hypothetical protein
MSPIPLKPPPLNWRAYSTVVAFAGADAAAAQNINPKNAMLNFLIPKLPFFPKPFHYHN